MDERTQYTLKLERATPLDHFDDMVRLVSRDGQRFRVAKYVVLLSNLISFKVLYQPNKKFYNLPNVDGSTLSRVLEFCSFHSKQRPVNSEKKIAAFIEIEKPLTKGAR